MLFKRSFTQQNGLKSYGLIDLSKAVQIEVVSALVPEKDLEGNPVLNEAGEPIDILKEGIVLTFPWTVQRMFPKPKYQPGGKGKEPRLTHYDQEVMWTNYTVVIDVPEEVEKIKAYIESVGQ